MKIGIQKMKKPKEPKIFKWPRMYATFHGPNPKYCRLRIIEPDGTCTWYPTHYHENGFLSCCWARKGLSPKQQIKRMKEHDKLTKGKTIFIGEIK